VKPFSTVSKVLLTIGIACLISIIAYTLFLSSLGIYDYFHPNLDVEISGPALISNNWLEITPQIPLRAKRVVQQVVAYVDKPVTKDRDSFELVFPDGSRVTPEVEVIDDDGKIYKLTDASSITTPKSSEAFQRGFGAWQLPNDKVYRKVRIRSSKPFMISKLVWRCYDPRDRG